MTLALPFHDLAAWAEAYLEPRLGGVPVHVRVPTPRPQRFVLVDVSGGAQTSVITANENLNVTAYDRNYFEAQKLSRLVQLLLNSIRRDPTVRDVTAFMGPFNFDDPSGAPAVKTSYRVLTRAH